MIDLLGLRVHPQRYQIEIDGKFIQLTPVEMTTLLLMARRPERVFTFDQILDAYHEGYHEVTPQAAKGVIYRLRQKMGRYRHLIRPVRGIGYVIRLTDHGRLHALAWPVPALVAWWGRMTTPAKASVATGACCLTLFAGGAASYVSGGGTIPFAGQASTSFLSVASTAPSPQHLALATQAGLPSPPNLEHGIGTSLASTSVPNEFITVAHPHPEEGSAPSRLHSVHVLSSPDNGIIKGVWAIATHRITTDAGTLRPYANHSGRLGPNSRIPAASAVRMLPDGTVVTLAPDGDAILHQDLTGRWLATYPIPAELRQTVEPGSDHLAPRPIENLATTPAGRILAIGRQQTVASSTIPLLVLDPASPQTAGLVDIPLDPGHTVHDVLAIDEQRLLLLEWGETAEGNASPQSLHLVELPVKERQFVRKRRLLDLLALMPKDLRTIRLEGIAFGSRLPDGRRVLLALDSRAHLRESNHLYAFALNTDLFETATEATNDGD